MDPKTRYIHAVLGESSENACCVMDEQLSQGLALWDCPQWVDQLPFRLGSWAHHGDLVKLRLVAEWLLRSAPQNCPSELQQMLCSFVDGDFCEGYPDAACRWPASPGMYARQGNLGMAEIAVDWESMAWVNHRLSELTGKPLKVPVASSH